MVIENATADGAATGEFMVDSDSTFRIQDSNISNQTFSGDGPISLGVTPGLNTSAQT